MKLIFCTECHDIVKLTHSKRVCSCSQSWGRYEDNINARIGGKAVPLGFANPSFVQALKSRPESGDGREFCAFVIPKVCPTVKSDE